MRKTTQASAGLQVGENAALHTVKPVPALLPAVLATVLNLGQTSQLIKVQYNQAVSYPVQLYVI